MSVLATYLILLSGCDRNDLCYDHPHENLHVAVVWDSVPAELQTSLPEGVRISMYAVQQARQEQSGATILITATPMAGMLPCRTAYTTSCFSTVIPKGYNCAAWTICTRRKLSGCPYAYPL